MECEHHWYTSHFIGFMIKHGTSALTPEIVNVISWLPAADTDLAKILVNVTSQSAQIMLNHCYNCNHECNCWFFFEVVVGWGQILFWIKFKTRNRTIWCLFPVSGLPFAQAKRKSHGQSSEKLISVSHCNGHLLQIVVPKRSNHWDCLSHNPQNVPYSFLPCMMGT